MGIDGKTKANIYANEYIDFATALPRKKKATEFEPSEKDRALVLILLNVNNQSKLETHRQWVETSHVYVGIYCQKHHKEITP